ncbi:hypothetical protein RD792_006779 [Penstemon davidsonii]|uniref:Cyclin-like domain-containing protein n=1 Tax=Penstemon davidsonii TaxID=160366 RepID=A0ABR0DCF3_9LAMI|nr:hypothetical protein RD792_006779 [Penstemon davidsonii]
MAALLCGEPSHLGAPEANYRVSQERPEEGGGRWYFSRKEIEENSPSRLDGIDLKKEAYLRKSYCTFLQDLGMRLKVPQVTIATAMIFCHRFFLRQSLAKNDRRVSQEYTSFDKVQFPLAIYFKGTSNFQDPFSTIATVCMFLAGKVEETPRPLKDVIMVSYEIIHKKDAAAVQRIKQKEVYEQQKELILLGERVLLGTLGYDFNVHHPYKPLVEAIKKFKVAQNALAQVAWNFVNDGLRTSLCLQFKPHHIAAGAIFLAAKFLKVKLPSDGEKVWWQEFDVTPRQLEGRCFVFGCFYKSDSWQMFDKIMDSLVFAEVSNQMLELYEQNRLPPSQASEAEGSAGGSQRPQSKGSADEKHVPSSSHNSKAAAPVKPVSSRPIPDQPHADNHSGPPRISQTRNNEYENSEISSIQDHKRDDKRETMPHQGNSVEIQNKPKFGIEGHSDNDQEGNSGKTETRDILEPKDKYHGRNLPIKDSTVAQSPQDATKKLDKEKLKAAFERRKARGDITRKIDPMDELERELEDIEVPSEKREKKQSWSKPSHENNSQHVKGQSSIGDDLDTVEEGELAPFDDADRGYQSPRSNTRKRKPGSPLHRPQDGKQKQNHHAYPEDRNGTGRLGSSERDNKRHLQENHV